MNALLSILSKVAIHHGGDLFDTEEVDKRLEKFVKNKLLNSDVMQKACSISDEEMELAYKEGYDYYLSDFYDEASNVFKWLILLNTFVPKYWSGYAASLQMKESYEEALKALAIVAMFDMNDPYPHFHAYECYLQLNESVDSFKALSLSHELALANPSAYKALLDKINSITNVKQQD